MQSQNVQLQQPLLGFYCLALKCVILTAAREEIKGTSHALKPYRNHKSVSWLVHEGEPPGCQCFHEIASLCRTHVQGVNTGVERMVMKLKGDLGKSKMLHSWYL